MNRPLKIVRPRTDSPPSQRAVGDAPPRLVALAGWGNHPVVEGYERRSEDLEAITRDVVLTRGLGRSYGDSSLPPPGRHVVAGSPLADRVLAFDPDTGVVRAEAGFTLMNLNRLFFSRGWFTPVTPGTRFVTLGGAIASGPTSKGIPFPSRGSAHSAPWPFHHLRAIARRLDLVRRYRR